MEEHVRGASRGRLGAGLAGMLAREDPAEALAWVETNLYGRARADGLRSLIHEGAASHGERVARIADDLPSGNLKTETIQTLIGDWVQRDTDGAVSWMALLETDSAREAAKNGVETSPLSRGEKKALLARLSF